MPTPTLPTVRGSAQALYPVTRRIEFDTAITIAANGSEQRWARRAPLFRFGLPYQNLSLTDATALRTFYLAQKGMDSLGWQFILGTTTYGNLTFEDDGFTLTERIIQRYDIALKFRQTQNLGFTLPSPAGSFPTLSSGATVQLPYSETGQFNTVAGDSPTGQRYTYEFYNGGLTNYPARDLKRWKPSYPLLTDADVAILEPFFLGQQGRLGQFSFTSPFDGTVYSNVRFGDDVLELQYQGPNQTACSFSLIETNN